MELPICPISRETYDRIWAVLSIAQRIAWQGVPVARADPAQALLVITGWCLPGAPAVYLIEGEALVSLGGVGPPPLVTVAQERVARDWLDAWLLDLEHTYAIIE